MSFEYDSDTRQHYKNDEIAEAYHAAFAGGRGRTRLAHRVVAHRERVGVLGLLSKVPHARVLDVPCGTGKLAPVFASLGCRVVAGDVSPNMIAIAQAEYARAGLGDTTFEVIDITRLAEASLGQFDVAVCLRLLHRVPPDVKTEALRELAKCAKFAVVSFAIETGFHKIRRAVRGAVLGGDTSSLCFEPLALVRDRVATDFDIVEERWVFRGVSQEILYLLRSRA